MMTFAMQAAHGRRVGSGIPFSGEAAHYGVIETPKGAIQVFVRAVWRLRRLVDLKQTLREMDIPTTGEADNLGMTGPDFSKMTRGLFDR